MKYILLFVIIVSVLLFATLYRNDAHLLQPPGFAERMKIFLTSNSAKTSDQPVLEELKTPVFNMPADQLYHQVIEAAMHLGWSIADHDNDNQNAHFVISSPIFMFEDDMIVQVEYLNAHQSALHITSQSRTGRADLAANSSHIQRLLQQLR
jgi:uncharacterized protein (DUF1499 family)